MTCEQASALMGVALFVLHAPHRLFLALLDPPCLVDGHHDTFCTFALFSIYFSCFNSSAFLSYIRSLLTLLVHFVLPLALMIMSRKSAGAGTLYMEEASEPFGLLEVCEKQRNGRSNAGFVSFYIYSFPLYNAASRHLVPYSRDEYHYFSTDCRTPQREFYNDQDNSNEEKKGPGRLLK